MCTGRVIISIKYEAIKIPYWKFFVYALICPSDLVPSMPSFVYLSSIPLHPRPHLPPHWSLIHALAIINSLSPLSSTLIHPLFALCRRSICTFMCTACSHPHYYWSLIRVLMIRALFPSYHAPYLHSLVYVLICTFSIGAPLFVPSSMSLPFTSFDSMSASIYWSTTVRFYPSYKKTSIKCFGCKSIFAFLVKRVLRLWLLSCRATAQDPLLKGALALLRNYLHYHYTY